MTAATPGPCDAGVAIATAGAMTEARTPHPQATLAATILGSSVAFIDGSVVNVALPAMASDLGAGPAGLSWIVNAYLLPLGALTLLGGGAGDHFGRRRLFQIGLAVFLAASALCTVAPSLDWLLGGRALQGVGAALLLPNSLGVLGAAFSGEARGRAVGTWAAVGAIAGALGPLLGGWLVDTTGWRMIFALNLPVGAAAGWLAWRYVTESRGDSGESLDWAGALMATVALGMLTWALTAATETAALSGFPAAALVGGFVLLGLFLWHEGRRGDGAMMPLALFGTATFAGLTILTFFLYAALSGLLVLLPFLLIRVEGYTAVAAGAALLPLPVLIGLGSRLMGRLAERLGGRPLLTGGALTVAVGFALYLRVGNGRIDYWTDLLPAILVGAIGMAICVAPLTTAVMSSVDPKHVGTASGFNSAVARIGGLIATALLGSVFAEQGATDDFLAAFRAAAWVGAGLAALAGLSAFLLISPASAPDDAS